MGRQPVKEETSPKSYIQNIKRITIQPDSPGRNQEMAQRLRALAILAEEPYGGLKLPYLPRDLTPSSGFYRHQTFIHRHKIEINHLKKLGKILHVLKKVINGQSEGVTSPRYG